MKTLLIISGGTEAVPGIHRAREMDLHVVVSDGNPGAPGFEYAHDKIVASTYDIEATLQAAKDYQTTHRPIDGVICIAADVPLTVASVAAELGLPGIPVEAARLAIDKMAMKQCFVEAGVPVSWFSLVENADHLRALIKERGFDLVIKPVDSRGARGVLRLSKTIDLDWAYEYALSQSPSGRVMVERFLAGPQISTESILLNEKQAVTPGFSDRNYEFLERFAPNIIENGGEQPSVLSSSDQQAIVDMTVRAARAMGIQKGTAKGDMILTPDGPMVIEIAARLSGGWFCTDQIPLATGVDFVGAAIRIALGELVNIDEVTPKFQEGVAIRYFFPDAGRIVAIENIEHYRKMPGVSRIEIVVQPGEVIAPASNHTERAGFVITVGDTRQKAVALAEEVIESVRIQVESECDL